MTTPTPSEDIVERWPGYDEQSWQERFAVMERKRDELCEMTLRFAQIRHDEQRIHADEIARLRARVDELEGESARLRDAGSPFAAVADEYDDGESDDFEVWMDAGPQRNIRSTFKLGMYRKLRAALHPTDEESRDG